MPLGQGEGMSANAAGEKGRGSKKGNGRKSDQVYIGVDGSDDREHHGHNAASRRRPNPRGAARSSSGNANRNYI
ncbi:hypothetical protein PAAG_12269 [Paracoccidioides lutzii Pb01]|uniref:Uncharacterized protein n=1 Tax=Paracoccidioides lutzii (strain ATCC MYA-826 / Pb01) TaxID=502779 RepID=A0A0A2V4K3_PARBA|nr:hypothetical protein PAAG_12269 [Paracoccidioides lutzii Pb01]KGQ01075.1 hypothetical protein PAAG_12269 [Paracoccidioides lutzii Pb01]